MLGERYWDDGLEATTSTRAVPGLETRVQDHGPTDSSLASVVLWQEAQCRFIQVCTGLRDQGLLALEPMSGQTDCFNNGDGLVVALHHAGPDLGGDSVSETVPILCCVDEVYDSLSLDRWSSWLKKACIRLALAPASTRPSRDFDRMSMRVLPP